MFPQTYAECARLVIEGDDEQCATAMTILNLLTYGESPAPARPKHAKPKSKST